jgi:receptor expression-enhancing protein 1/2/3/4
MQGSTFIYDSYLAPYFVRNEAAIDRNIATAEGSIIVFAQERIRAIWNFAWNAISQAQNQAAQSEQVGGAAPAVGSPAAIVGNLWRAYGATLMAGMTGSTGASPQSSAPQSQLNTPAGTPGTQPYARTPFTASATE